MRLFKDVDDRNEIFIFRFRALSPEDVFEADQTALLSEKAMQSISSSHLLFIHKRLLV